MGIEAGVMEAGQYVDDLTPIVRRLGTAIFTHKKKQEQAKNAEKAIDYLVEQGVLGSD